MVGNIPNYTKFDIIRCFFHLDKKRSRAELAKKLELGEGTVRTILDILKNKGLIISGNQGHILTQKGTNILKRFKSLLNIKEVKLRLYPKLKSVALSIKSNKRISYEQRDLAVKSGAEGAIITYIKNKRLVVPDKSALPDFLILEKKFPMNEGNIMILTFSENLRKAENAAVIVASNMNVELETLIDENFKVM